MVSSTLVFTTVALLLLLAGCCAKTKAPEVADCINSCQKDSQAASIRFTRLDIRSNRTDRLECMEGCRIWEKMNPTVDSCEASCLLETNALESQDGDAGSTMVNCRRGCHYARDNYIRRVEGYNLSGTVQYAITKGYDYKKSEDFLTGWGYVPQKLTVNTRGYYNVTGLRSYTFYSFRLEVRATPEKVFYSRLSVPVKTMEGGAPLDSPVIKDIQAVSCHDIFLVWDPPKEPNGNIIAYQIRYKNDHSLDWKTESAHWNERSHTLSELSPGTVYYIAIRGTNPYSMYGPWSETVNVTTPYAPGNRRSLGKDPAALLWANHQEIRYIPDTWDFLNMRIQSEFTVYPFDHGFDENTSDWKSLPNTSAESPQAFKDFVFDTRRKLAFVLTIGGSLDVIDLTVKSRRHLVQLAEAGWVHQIQELSYDWLNMQVYFVRTKEQELWRCSIADLDKMVPEKVGSLTRDEDWSSSLKPSTRKIVADPINGYIFWLQSNGQFSSIYLSHLPENDIHPIELVPERIVEDGFEVKTFVVDFEKCRIIFPEGRRSGEPNADKKVFATSCTTRSDLQDNQAVRSGHSYGLAEDMVLFEDNFYFFDHDRLYREHKVDGGRYQVDIRRANLEYGTGSVIAMRSYNTESQPIPYPVNAPSDIQIYVSADSMYIIWKPPHQQHWQSPTAWNVWSYNVTVTSQSPRNFTFFLDTDATEAQIPGLTPNATYSVQITAVQGEKTGAPSDPLHIRTYPAHAPNPEVLLTYGSFLLNVTLQSSPGERQMVRQGDNLHAISDTIWAPDFLAVYDAPKHLVVFPNSGNAMEERHYHIADAVSLAYDWIGRKMYWADLISKKIKRATLSTPLVSELLVDGPEARHIVLDPLRGSMYFCTDYVLETARLNGQNRRVLMSLTPTGTVSFLGVAIDSDKKMFYAVIRRSATMEVYGRALVPSFADDGMQLVASLPISSRPTRKEIAVVDDRLLWLDGGQLAVTDMQYPYDTIRLYDRLSSFTRVNRFDEELQGLNRTFADFRVTPNAVNESQIRLEEEGENSIKFSWPKEDSNYGRVQYEVTVTDTQGKSLLAERVSDPQVVVKDVSQEAHLQISIQALTEWASAPVVQKRFVGQQLPRSSSWNGATIAALVMACLVLLLLIPGLFAYAFMKERRKRLSRRATPECGNRITWDGVKSPFSDNAVYDLRDLDISALPKLTRDNIVLGDFLGRGAFGAVHKGVSNGELADIPPGTPLAVKQLRPETDDGLTDFLKEACFMSQIQHPNILHFYGVCVEKEPFYIVMEYMNSGDLLSYLQSTCAPATAEPYAAVVSSLTVADLLNMARDINQGCVYLEDTKKIHRDLAARNCLVRCEEVDGAVRRTVKIADFGMSRDVYSKDYYRRGMRRGGPGVPVKWMAPECLTENIHTTQSDVWSFGVVLYELMAYGQKGPYHELSNDYVLEMQKRGGIHPLMVDKTMELEPTVRNVMLQCWKMNRDERPTFRSVLQVLESLLENYMTIDEARSQGETEVFLINEKHQTEGAMLTGSGKCESFPTLRRREHTPDSHHFYRSSPAILHQDSTGSDDSGVAITPKNVSKLMPPRSQFVMPSRLPGPINKPPVHGSIPLDESGYLSYNPELIGPPPYLNVLGSSDEVSLGHRVPVVKPQQSSANSFSLSMNPTNASCSVLKDTMII